MDGILRCVTVEDLLCIIVSFCGFEGPSIDVSVSILILELTADSIIECCIVALLGFSKLSASPDTWSCFSIENIPF